MLYNSFNEDSRQKIQNIVNGFRNHPGYSAYEIKSYTYNLQAGVHALEISRNGQFINLWLFFPGVNGKIESIALYGANLQGHYNAMRSSMKAFGLPISSISFDSGNETFLDIHLDY